MLSPHTELLERIHIESVSLLLKGLPRRPNMLHQTVKGLQQQNLCALQDRAERRVGMKCLKGEGHSTFKSDELLRFESRDSGVEGDYSCVGFVVRSNAIFPSNQSHQR